MSWYPVMKLFSPIISSAHTTSTSYPLHCTKTTRKTNFYTKLHQSPFIWCIIILIYVIYVVHKKNKYTEETILIDQPKQKQQKRQKEPERQFKSQPILTGDEIVDPVSSYEWTQIGEKVKKKKKRKNRTKSKKNNKNEPTQPKDFNLISPAITPVTSEDELEIAKPKRLYSPFLTGLDLDILPRTDPLVQYRIDSFLHSIPPPSPPLLSTDYISSSIIPPSTFEPIYPRPTSIKVLENHPFISTSSGENAQHHHHHRLGPIGGSIRSHT
ncbi:hypothetical protein K501DRAFT_328305 [Backusella circina FSU 941]|nr:hypothetical protein K501DRAFT_328305 [Backusella circina FSU 941]